MAQTESTCNAGYLGLTPELGWFPGGGHGNPLQYSYLENPMDRGAYQTTVCGVSKSWTWLKRLGMFIFNLILQRNYTLMITTSTKFFQTEGIIHLSEFLSIKKTKSCSVSTSVSILIEAMNSTHPITKTFTPLEIDFKCIFLLESFPGISLTL